MRVLAVAAIWCIAVVGVSSQTTSPPSSDETAVREIVRKYVDAREKRDPKLLEALFTADADQLTTSGRGARDATTS